MFEEGDFTVATDLPNAASDQFGLQRVEEAFDGGIVVTIVFPAHQGRQGVLAQQLLMAVCGVLRSAITVMNAANWRSPDRRLHDRRAGVTTPTCQRVMQQSVDVCTGHRHGVPCAIRTGLDCRARSAQCQYVPVGSCGQQRW